MDASKREPGGEPGGVPVGVPGGVPSAARPLACGPAALRPQVDVSGAIWGAARDEPYMSRATFGGRTLHGEWARKDGAAICPERRPKGLLRTLAGAGDSAALAASRHTRVCVRVRARVPAVHALLRRLESFNMKS